VPPGTVAVAVKRPAVPLATRTGDLAVPDTSVSAVVWAPAPPRKAAVAPDGPVETVKVTVAPSIGEPASSSTCTRSGAG
jgi:hypothetical protein